jgi:hypothetical protein
MVLQYEHLNDMLRQKLRDQFKIISPLSRRTPGIE